MQWPICHSENEVASTEFKDKLRRMKRTEINRKVPEEDIWAKTLSISREEMLGTVFIYFEQIILWLMSSFWTGSCGAGGFQKVSELGRATVEKMCNQHWSVKVQRERLEPASALCVWYHLIPSIPA